MDRLELNYTIDCENLLLYSVDFEVEIMLFT